MRKFSFFSNNNFFSRKFGFRLFALFELGLLISAGPISGDGGSLSTVVMMVVMKARLNEWKENEVDLRNVLIE